MDAALLIRRFDPRDDVAVRRLNIEALAGTGAVPTAPGWADDLLDVHASYVERGTGDFLVGTLADALVAMGGVLVDGSGVAELKRVRVSPALQGRGLGRLLVQALEARATELGAHTIFADTTVQQVGAQRLYASAGYQVVDRKEVDGFAVLRFHKHTAGLKLGDP